MLNGLRVQWASPLLYTLPVVPVLPLQAYPCARNALGNTAFYCARSAFQQIKIWSTLTLVRGVRFHEIFSSCNLSLAMKHLFGPLPSEPKNRVRVCRLRTDAGNRGKTFEI